MQPEPYSQRAVLARTMASAGTSASKQQERFHGAFTGGFSAGFYNSVRMKSLITTVLLYCICTTCFVVVFYTRYIFGMTHISSIPAAASSHENRLMYEHCLFAGISNFV